MLELLIKIGSIPWSFFFFFLQKLGIYYGHTQHVSANVNYIYEMVQKQNSDGQKTHFQVFFIIERLLNLSKHTHEK